MVKVYIVSKPKYIPKINTAIDIVTRDQPHIKVVSTWLSLGIPRNEGEWRDLWTHCIKDVCYSDMVVILPDKNGEFRGGLVEIGAALSAKIPLYQIGSCKSFKADDLSDSSFTLHNKYYRDFANVDLDMDTIEPIEIATWIIRCARREFGPEIVPLQA